MSGEPLQDIHLLLRGNGPPIQLGEVDAADSYRFRIDVRIPMLVAGRYRVVANHRPGEGDPGYGRATSTLLIKETSRE